MSAEPAHAYDVDTAVEAVADRPGETGRFAAVITDRWNVLGGRPNGGYVLGVALRALARVMPMPDPLVVSAFFLRPTLPGPVAAGASVEAPCASTWLARPSAKASARPSLAISRAPGRMTKD